MFFIAKGKPAQYLRAVATHKTAHQKGRRHCYYLY